MIAIIDYGMGNLGSILNMFKKIGGRAEISSNPREIEKAEKIVLPGVGAFDAGMKRLNDLGLVALLNELVLERKVPLLGVCLGMQLLTRRSEEGDRDGFGWIDGETVRFRFGGEHRHLKIPHMGWNTLRVLNQGVLFKNLEEEARFYFVHSYHVVCNQSEDVSALTHYGYDFPAAVEKGNVLGAQFHPEKSHRYGMQVLRGFVEMT